MSHFFGLMSTKISKNKLTEENDIYTDQLIQCYRNMLESGNKTICDNIIISMLKYNLESDFAVRLYTKVNHDLEKYSCECFDKEYIDFDEDTERLLDDYNTYSINCIRFTNGTIIPLYQAEQYGYCISYKGSEPYCVKSIKPNGTKRRDKKSKKARIINCKVNKIFKTVEDYAEYIGMSQSEDNPNVYGYYFNMYSLYDSFCIGGYRLIDTFIVKEDCKEYSLGDVNYPDHPEEDQPIKLPDGYKWVNAAKKKDIQWDMMKNIFSKFEDYSEYQDDVNECKYLINSCYDLTIDSENYNMIDSLDTNEYVKTINDLIDSFDDDTIIVSIDFHI